MQATMASHAALFWPHAALLLQCTVLQSATELLLLHWHTSTGGNPRYGTLVLVETLLKA